MVKKVLSALILLLTAFSAAAAASSVTLYSQGIACINETRSVNLKVGENIVDLPIPAGLIPESLAVKFSGQVISQSFHYTPPDSVLAAAVGRTVEVVAPDGSVYQGILLSTSGGITLRDKTGMINVIREPTRVSLAENNLFLSPSIELRLNSPAAGKIPIEITYLTTGFNWKMSYVGTLAADGKTLTLTGWAPLVNQTNYGFSAATVRLIAGQVNQIKANTGARAAPLALEAAPMQAQSAFEYYLYSLPGPVDLPAKTSVLIPYGAFPSVSVEKTYTYDGARTPGVAVSLKFVNAKAKGIGVPLPAGAVRLFQSRPDGTIFIGADTIPHTPVGETVSVQAGSAFDITGTRTELSNVKISGATYRASYRVTLHNHKDKAVMVNVLEHPTGRSWKITAASQPYIKVNSGTIEFVVQAPANGESEVTYTIEYSY